jgi:hypothetical protein
MITNAARGRRPRLTAATITKAVLAALVGVFVSAPGAHATTQVFQPSGVERTWTVPQGITTVKVTAVGADGGDNIGTGGSGARVEGLVLPVTPGQVFYINVGGQGSWRVGGFNGGGRAGYATGGGQGGGGASDIRTVSRTEAGSLDSRLLVAPGGGGASYTSGGNWESPGAAYQCGTNVAGQAASGSAGGAGGPACFTYQAGSAGSFGEGGESPSGGGGGGGWYGGGGGGVNAGGGGGSRYLDASIQGTPVWSNGDGNSRVTLTYPSVTASASPDFTFGDSASSGTLSATASLADAADGGEYTFKLFGPDDSDCTGTPVFTSQSSDPQSGAHTPTRAGDYRWVVTHTGSDDNDPVSDCDDPNAETTVTRNTPDEITVQVDPENAVVDANRTRIEATGTSLGHYGPHPAAEWGTLRWRVYGPDDPDCTGTPLADEARPYSRGSSPMNYNGVIDVGVYRWAVSYSGDAYNAPTATGCNAAGSVSTIERSSTSTQVQAPATGVITQPLSATATVGGLVMRGTPVPEFHVYGPDDTGCSRAPVATLAGDWQTNSEARSAQFTPSEVGDYRWVASYPGDRNNEPSASACDAAGTTTVVDLAQPAISGEADETWNPDGDRSQPIRSDARVDGRTSPTADGTVTFRAYHPDDTDCTDAPAHEETKSLPTDQDTVQAGGFVPDQAGIYRWHVSYSGDSNNKPATGTCGGQYQETTVAKALVALQVDASEDITVGKGDLAATGAAADRWNPQPGNTLDFRLYGPDDADCSADPVFESLDRSVDADGVAASESFTPTVPGVYRWQVSYSGDLNNNTAQTDCDEPEGRTTVAPAPRPDPDPDPDPDPNPGTDDGTQQPQPNPALPQPSAAPDLPVQPEQQRPARLRISHRRTLTRNRLALVTVTCRAAAGRRCKGSLTLQSTPLLSRRQTQAAGVKAKLVRFDLAAGQRKHLRVRVPDGAFKRVGSHRKAVVRVVRRMAGALTKTKLLSVYRR